MAADGDYGRQQLFLISKHVMRHDISECIQRRECYSEGDWERVMVCLFPFDVKKYFDIIGERFRPSLETLHEHVPHDVTVEDLCAVTDKLNMYVVREVFFCRKRPVVTCEYDEVYIKKGLRDGTLPLRDLPARHFVSWSVEFYDGCPLFDVFLDTFQTYAKDLYSFHSSRAAADITVKEFVEKLSAVGAAATVARINDDLELYYGETVDTTAPGIPYKLSPSGDVVCTGCRSKLQRNTSVPKCPYCPDAEI